MLLGIHASIRYFFDPERCEEVRLAQATGVQALREDMSWARIEPQPGRWNWAEPDGLVSAATEAGMMLLPALDNSPSWAAPTGATLPANAASYAGFVAAAVARYGPGGAFWRANPRLPKRPLVWFELWNEPYYADGRRDPAIYARLVETAVTAARNANPAARYLIEGATPYQTSSGVDWNAGMYAAVPDLSRYFDAMALHPYGGDPATQSGAAGAASPARIVESARSELVAHGDGDKPLWLTEIGWSTCSGTARCVTEAEQATYLRTFLMLARTAWRSYVRAVFVYDLRDLGPAPLADRENWFGVLRLDLSHKPAWQVLHDAARGAT